jgi:hypothetical protein
VGNGSRVRARRPWTAALMCAGACGVVLGCCAAAGAQGASARLFTIAGTESAGLNFRTACVLEICTNGSPPWVATEKRLGGGCVRHRQDGVLLACSVALISIDRRGRARPHRPPSAGPTSEIRDADVTPDGAVVVLEVDGDDDVWRVWRLRPDGSSVQLGSDISSGRPLAVAAAADGSAYALDGGRQIVTRMSPGGAMTTIAGSYREGTAAPRGFSGDGGPATQATFDGPSDIDTLPDESLVIADTDNARIRRVAPDGVITTIAGGGIGWREGAPSPTVALGGPRVLRATRDGALLIASRRGLVRRHPSGTIRTITRIPGEAWSGAAEAGDPSERRNELNTDGRPLGDVSLAEVRDVDELPDGTLVLALGSRVAWLATAGATQRLAVALPAGNRVTLRSGVVQVRSTRPAAGRVELLRGARVITSRRVRLLGRRATTLRLPVRASSSAHTLRVTARDTDGARASHHLSVIPGAALGPRVLDTLTRWVQRAFSFAKSGRSVDRCHRRSQRAFRCRTTVISDTVSSFSSILRLRRDGLLSYDGLLFEPPGG